MAGPLKSGKLSRHGSHTGGIKSRRRIAIRRYTCVAAFGRKPLISMTPVV